MWQRFNRHESVKKLEEKTVKINEIDQIPKKAKYIKELIAS
jgi:hypothetical protein